MSNEQITTSSVWRTQDNQTGGPHDSSGTGRTEGTSQRDEYGDPGISGTPGKETVFDQSRIVGIITQELKQAQEKLGNAEECLKWYEREREKALKEINQWLELLDRYSQKASGASTVESDRSDISNESGNETD